MKFNARGQLKGNPEFSAKVKIDPLRFDTKIGGSCDIHIGAITGEIGEIRVRMAIPFLKRRRKPPVVATVGPFPINLKPFDICCGTRGVQVGGVLGTEGIGAHAETRVACQMEGNVEGDMPVKHGHLHVELDENESD